MRWTFRACAWEALETPGHTIESISILVFDLQKDRAQTLRCT